jgi:hypothetical protein
LTDVANAEVASGRMKLTERQLARIEERVAEAARELGVLWLTFSLLDRLVAGTFTFLWALSNFSMALVFWTVGLYIEVRRR